MPALAGFPFFPSTLSWSALLELEESFRFADGAAWFAQHERKMYVACAAYLVCVFAGQRLMSERAKFSLRPALAVWNLLLSAVTILMASRIVPEFARRWADRGFQYAVCDNSFTATPAALMVAWFSLSKFPEFGDTAFIVLKKRPLILLHYWHHTSVAFYSWWSFQYGSGNGLFFQAMNTVVHSLMYPWYMASAMGYPLRAIAPFITFIQIVQMVLGLGLSVYTLYLVKAEGESCMTPEWLAWVGAGIYLSYFVLFSIFFADKYMNKKSKGGKANKAKTN
jgi:elongation of very long chain fatty acids protein 6